MIALTIHDSYEMVTFNLIHLLVKNSAGYSFKNYPAQIISLPRDMTSAGSADESWGIRPMLGLIKIDRPMKIAEIKDALNATVLAGEDQMEDIITGAGSADLMDDVLAAATEKCVLLTGVVTEQVIRTAKIARVGVIVFVRGKQPQKDVIALAASYKIPLLLTRYSLFVASGKLYMEGLRGLDGSW